MHNIDVAMDIKIGGTVIERVDNYVGLGNKVKLGLDNQTAEVKIWIGLGRKQLSENGLLMEEEEKGKEKKKRKNKNEKK